MSSEPLTAEQIEELKKRHIRSFCMRPRTYQQRPGKGFGRASSTVRNSL